MDQKALVDAVGVIKKTAADLEPELLQMSDARNLLSLLIEGQRAIEYAVTSLTRKISDPHEVAKVTGTSLGKAKAVVATGQVLRESGDLEMALQQGAVSLDQAVQIAEAEESSPGAAKELVAVAQTESFHVLRDKARKVKLEAEQHRDLGPRQKAARSGRGHVDQLGMTDIHLRFEPHIGTPIMAQAEADAQRLAKAARKRGEVEPFERYVADAFAAMLGGKGKGRARRPELVVLVSHEVAKRGWKDVRESEVCKIPGVGPVPPEVAKEIAQDAFLSGVFYDGTDLRHFKRWSRNISIEVRTALELGEPPDFNGVKCVDCGNRFRTEFDHVKCHAGGGPASLGNFDPRCPGCHQIKTDKDRDNNWGRDDP